MSFRLLIITFCISTLGISLTGCDPLAKLSKNGTVAEKDSAAFGYYNKGKYEHAVFLLEELSGVYRGTPRHRDIYYTYAWAKYKLGEQVMAAYYFGDFTRQYPRDEKLEECRYMEAHCYFLLADPWYLDQQYTKKGIESLQLFLDAYSYSEFKDKAANELMELRERLARKAFEQANLYLNLGYYKAGLISFTSFINQFPDSRYREEAQFKLFRSAALYCIQSQGIKKAERLSDAKGYYEKFVDKFPGSKFAKDAENLLETATRNLAKHQRQTDKKENNS